jgi:hypothetical protein
MRLHSQSQLSVFYLRSHFVLAPLAFGLQIKRAGSSVEVRERLISFSGKGGRKRSLASEPYMKPLLPIRKGDLQSSLLATPTFETCKLSKISESASESLLRY